MKPDNKSNNSIRVATLDDVTGLVELTKDIPLTYGMEELAPYDPEMTRESYIDAIQNNLCFLSESNDEDGFISVLKLSVRSNWWSRKEYLTNDILYASEGQFGIKLLREYIKIIKYITENNDIPFVFDMVNYNVNGVDDINKKERMFLKLFKGSTKIASSLRVG